MDLILILFIFLAVVGILLIATWIFYDAKANNIKPWPWVLITCFLSPNFLGLVLYILYRRQGARTRCEHCNKWMVTSANYCPQCGAKNSEIDHSSHTSPSYRVLIIGIIFLLIALLGFIGYIFKSPDSPMKHRNSSRGLLIQSSNRGNEWHYKFYYLQGKVHGKFTAEGDDDKLIYSSKLEKGTISFELYNSADSLLVSFSGSEIPDTLKGFTKGEKYWVKAIVENGKGRFDMEMK